MNSKTLKNKIAISCNGNLKKYFKEVELINKIILKNKCNELNNKTLHKIFNN